MNNEPPETRNPCDYKDNPVEKWRRYTEAASTFRNCLSNHPDLAAFRAKELGVLYKTPEQILSSDQEAVYYVASRVRACCTAFLHDCVAKGTKTEEWWLQKIAQEIRQAMQIVGQATANGSPVDVPHVLVETPRLLNRTSMYRFELTEFWFWVLQTSDTDPSRIIPKYHLEWWLDPMNEDKLPDVYWTPQDSRPGYITMMFRPMKEKDENHLAYYRDAIGHNRTYSLAKPNNPTARYNELVNLLDSAHEDLQRSNAAIQDNENWLQRSIAAVERLEGIKQRIEAALELRKKSNGH
ncbi:hypothetical protein Hypma_003367 [Hypsizygus marmoreus]|uniref:Uncharacterized protein n=1 Tax=Hypsizygus marmoreus TaxID=39966 RepID=A0A369J6D2_HYPMA|nr:hypothetical protein Hypma_003367 [Hypsizygus marmoreus]